MTDREKVIKRLEACLPPHDPNCDLCPYDSIDLRCRAKLRDDVMALLKAQKPRVMTLNEIDKDDGTEIRWLERKNGTVEPCRMILHADRGKITIGRISMPAIHVPIGLYGITYRCWTESPTDEQREAVKWNS